MRSFKKFFICFIVLPCILYTGVFLSTREVACASEKERARNIILMIADGMGPGEFALALDYSLLIKGRELNMERVIKVGHLGLILTRPLLNLVTDSAASATAMSTGKRTVINRIAKSKQGKDQETILEIAKGMGKSTGLVTTTRISDATPAAFGSHSLSRENRFEILDQFLEKGIDVLMGGGIQDWMPKKTRVGDFSKISLKAGAEKFSKRKDKKNLIKEAEKRGYQFISQEDELIKAPDDIKLLGLFSSSHFLMALDRKKSDHTGIPNLALMTEKALKVLDRNEGGFFLMIEGGRIDHAGHNNDAASVVAEILDFDEAVGAAFQFCKEKKDTLLLITSDHTTGGMGLSYIVRNKWGSDFGSFENLKAISRQGASFEKIWEEFGQKPTTDDIKRVIYKHTKIKISKSEAEFIKNPIPLSPFHVTAYKNKKKVYTAHAIGRVLAKRYQVSWSTGGHTNIPVMLIGYGINSRKVAGLNENRYIFDVMKEAFGLSVIHP